MKRLMRLFLFALIILSINFSLLGSDDPYAPPANSYRLSENKSSHMNTWDVVQRADNEFKGWWPLLQVVLWPNVPAYTSMDLYGIRTGIIYSGGTGGVYGMEMGTLLSYSEYVGGMQYSLFVNHSKNMDGFRLSMVNLSEKNVNGFQMAFANVNHTDSTGMDMAIINISSNSMKGFQMGLANYSPQPKFQIGIVNMATDYGIQIGVFNMIEDGWLPFFPGINLSF